MTTSISIIAGAGISTAVSGGTIDDFADSFVMGTATGAISGAVAASPLGVGGQMLVNTATSTLNYVGTQHLSNENVTLGGVISNAAVGTISGWIGGNGWMQSQKTGAFIAFKGQNALKHVFGMIGTKSLSKMTLPAVFVGGLGGGIYGRISEQYNENGNFVGF